VYTFKQSPKSMDMFRQDLH